MSQNNSLRELTAVESELVSGGFLPAIPAAIIAFSGHAAVRSLGGYFLSRIATASAIYNVAVAVGEKEDS